MANPIQTFYSDIVLGKVDSSDAGYSFLEMPIAYVETLKAGMMVDKAGVPVAAGSGANAYGVVTDRDLVPAYTPERKFTVGTTYNFTVAVRGLTLNKSKVVYADDSAIDDAALEALEAKGLKITDKYYDGSVEIPLTSV